MRRPLRKNVAAFSLRGFTLVEMLVATALVLLIMLLFQRQIISGLTQGAIKG